MFCRYLFSSPLLFGVLAAAACVKRGSTSSPLSSITGAQWQALNQSVDGRLHAGYPWARPCYTSYDGNASDPNSLQCSTIQATYTNETVIANYFGGYQNANWGVCQSTAEGCNLNATNPSDAAVYSAPAECHQGSVPSYYIEVTNVSDVQAALAFARSTKVPLVIKNSGHDYKGRSSAPNSLSLWTHNYQPPITLETDFVPGGCSASAGNGVTIGAGQGFDGLYAFAELNDITVVGGADKTVGAAGGWLAGGGHGALSNTLGLGVDNALEIKAVLPNGTYVTASRCQNQDIFYALRGGGGSTFGVTMEVTYKAHPRVTLQVAYAVFESVSNSTFSDFLKICLSNADKWASEGWGGYIDPTPSGEPLLSNILMMTPQLSLAQANASMAPILNFARSLGNATIEYGLVTVPSWYTAFETFIAPSTEKVDVSQSLTSRLIPRSLFQSSSGQQQILSALTNVANTVAYPGPYQTDPIAGYAQNPIQILVTAPANYPGDNTSSVTPAWRDSLWHVISGLTFSNEADAATIQSAFKGANVAGNYLRQLAPNSGAYQNEADVFEPNPAASYWGEANYQRLSTIKAELDPDNVLTCWDCIGFDKNDERYSCYPNIS
ncbi:MAG: hypothetical protein M1821_005115 [Bathelium mastoideum]|nr:MAG: hypothetical protein M1821_005115 [Bathelium mastoideum]KAI9684543.1 MAG: hypothetical protein M1822_005631 [Bathelium mastoideum]